MLPEKEATLRPFFVLERKSAIRVNRYSKSLYLVPERKLSFSPISASDSNFNPQNTQCIPVVKIFVFLDLNEKS
jgi:hypothetical protein